MGVTTCCEAPRGHQGRRGQSRSFSFFFSLSPSNGRRRVEMIPGNAGGVSGTSSMNVEKICWQVSSSSDPRISFELRDRLLIFFRPAGSASSPPKQPPRGEKKMNRKLRAALLKQPLSEVGFSKFRLYREGRQMAFQRFAD